MDKGQCGERIKEEVNRKPEVMDVPHAKKVPYVLMLGMQGT